ncbi:Leucine-rich repeat-containing protein 59 [Dissostichus eleginoides]|uniref:Leucine-rich repeat-containing protein 59 n=1 Tax=Dissostichus eleginoides TaxID=100907 RepID=A0AAD9F3Y6_DISEL|nr:Leucine-rich repeat-containing protein 59 [Dissostichus eleginoides]
MKRRGRGEEEEMKRRGRGDEEERKRRGDEMKRRGRGEEEEMRRRGRGEEEERKRRGRGDEVRACVTLVMCRERPCSRRLPLDSPGSVPLSSF